MTGIVLIEPLTSAHCEPLARLADTPLVSSTSSIPPDCTSAYFLELLRRMEEHRPDETHFSVQANGRIVGMTSLKKLRLKAGEGELSYWIEPGSWGKGFAQAAAAQTIAHGRGALGLTKVDAHFLRDANPASARVLEALGFARAQRDDEPVDNQSVGKQPNKNRFAVSFPGDAWRFYSLEIRLRPAP